jgi:prepilin signal peptidase PulO-like enzyme (type II secretory pathway)
MHPAWPHIMLAVATLAAAAVIGVHAAVLPPELVLPALSVMLIASALCVALFALLFPSGRGGAAHITCWDVSGALYLFGCCAAVLGEPEGVIALMEEIKIRK